MMLLKDVLANPTLDAAAASVRVFGLAYDSRQVRPGWLFAAWAGAQADGHAFVPQALKQGAVCILAERQVLTGGVPCVVVPDVRRALADAARRFHGDPGEALVMVGVTGTNGKTTSVHLMEAIFQAAGLSCGMIGTLGSRYDGKTVEGALTTPESVDLLALLATMRDAGVRAVAMEVSSQALAQNRVAGVRFDVGMFTNLTHDHLDYHGTVDNYFAAKAILLRQLLKPHGKGVVNMDDPKVRTLHMPGFVGFGMRTPTEVTVRHHEMDAHGMRLGFTTPRGELQVRSPLVGRFNIENIAGVVAAAIALDLPDAAIVAGIANLHAVPGRLERVSRPDQPLVLVDYAHTPDALQKALAAVREVTTGRLLCVFGCGGDRDPRKRGPMGQAALEGADWAMLTNDNPRKEDPAAIAQAVEAGLQAAGGERQESPQAHGYWVELDRARAIQKAIAGARPGDAVLIAGKGHETYQLIGSTKHAFDDRLVARQCLDGGLHA